MKPIPKFPFRGIAAGLMAVALVLAACGEKGSKSKAKKAASALSDFYYAQWRAPSPDWEIRKVGIGKDFVVNVETKIISKALTKAIMERSKLEQMGIARLACPAPNLKIWNNVSKEQPVNIRLSGSAGHIINALCKRPGEDGY